MALVWPTGAGAEQHAQILLGLVVAFNLADLPPCRASVVCSLSLHGLGKDRPSQLPSFCPTAHNHWWARPLVKTQTMAPRRSRQLGSAANGCRVRGDPALGRGLEPRRHRPPK